MVWFLALLSATNPWVVWDTCAFVPYVDPSWMCFCCFFGFPFWLVFDHWLEGVRMFPPLGWFWKDRFWDVGGVMVKGEI